ncbi:hypothetical protein OsJ_13368 [Oryza sativa Japonica Group]|nr:hypothetical protein OsJ_13368 [Oryza sativa Japonica Group]
MTNYNKSAITPIQCSQEQLQVVANELQCNIQLFPIIYLGLPLSTRKPTKAEVQPILDKLANKVAGWKPKLLSPDGRLCLIKSVLMALPVHFMSVLQLPKWAIKDIERKCRGFLWKGQQEVSGGHCLVAWKDVCTPVENGGLGIRNLELFGKALRLKWPANRLHQKDRPWTLVDFRLSADDEKIFQSASEFCVGNGRDTKFWSDNWLGGGSIAWRWPTLATFIGRTKLTVEQGLLGHRWVRDLQGSLSDIAMMQYFQLWDEIQQINLSQEEDTIRWKLTPDGSFSVSSAYDLFFMAREISPCGQLIWQTKAPSKASMAAAASMGQCGFPSARTSGRGADRLVDGGTMPFSKQLQEQL